MLEPYFENGNFQATKGNHPEKGKYPPTNCMAKFPQQFSEWKTHTEVRGGNADSSSSNTAIDECVSVLKTLVSNNSNTSNNTAATNIV